jgi:hypothetical protein
LIEQLVNRGRILGLRRHCGAGATPWEIFRNATLSDGLLDSMGRV